MRHVPASRSCVAVLWMCGRVDVWLTLFVHARCDYDYSTEWNRLSYRRGQSEGKQVESFVRCIVLTLLFSFLSFLPVGVILYTFALFFRKCKWTPVGAFITLSVAMPKQLNVEVTTTDAVLEFSIEVCISVLVSCPHIHTAACTHSHMYSCVPEWHMYNVCASESHKHTPNDLFSSRQRHLESSCLTWWHVHLG